MAYSASRRLSASISEMAAAPRGLTVSFLRDTGRAKELHLDRDHRAKFMGKEELSVESIRQTPVRVICELSHLIGVYSLQPVPL